MLVSEFCALGALNDLMANAGLGTLDRFYYGLHYLRNTAIYDCACEHVELIDWCARYCVSEILIHIIFQLFQFPLATSRPRIALLTRTARRARSTRAS